MRWVLLYSLLNRSGDQKVFLAISRQEMNIMTYRISNQFIKKLIFGVAPARTPVTWRLKYSSVAKNL